MADPFRDLERKIATGDAIVGVIGLGYLGLPLSCTIAERGSARSASTSTRRRSASSCAARPTFATSPESGWRRSLSRGGSAALVPARDLGFVPTADFDALRLCDAIVICVPTPLTEGREPDLPPSLPRERSPRRSAPGSSWCSSPRRIPARPTRSSGRCSRRAVFGPATTSPSLSRPEREDPGNRRYVTETIPKVVGGVTPRMRRRRAGALRQIVEESSRCRRRASPSRPSSSRTSSAA